MPSHRLFSCSLIALSVLCLASVASAQPPGFTHRNYGLRFLDVRVAELLAREECKASGTEFCQVTASGRTMLQVVTDDETHARIVRMLVDQDVQPQAQAFQLILLAARRGSSGTTAELPENARQALADVSQFLPFGSFELLDLAWMRTTERATALVAGPGGQDYTARIRFTYTDDPERQKILLDRFDLYELIPRNPEPRSAEGEGEEGSASGAHTSRTVLSTSFGMEIGETVVVGTSRLDGGDGALIVLLTAVP